jgi:hypothetical protein
MMRSRRRFLIPALVAASSMLFAACGGDEPTVLRLGANGSGAAAALASTESGSKMADMSIAPWGPPVFIRGADLVVSVTGAPAYRMTADVDADTVAALARAFGIDAVPVDSEGWWTVGDTTTRFVSVTGDQMGSWYFSDSAAQGSVTSSCPEPAVLPAADGSTPVPSPCPEPVPPSDLPSEDEARAKAIEVWTAAGMDLTGATITVNASEWGVWVDAVPTVDAGEAGRLSVEGLWANVGFGEGGALTYASGWLGTIEEVDGYDLVDIDTAWDRLVEDYTGDGMMPMARTAEDPAPGADAATGDAATSNGVEPDPVVVVDPTVVTVPGDAGTGVTVEPAVEPVDELPPADIEPREITVTGVEVVLTTRWGAAGEVYLVPAYRFADTDGGSWTVLALPDDVVEEVTPEPGAIEPAVDPAVDPAVGAPGVVEPGAEPGASEPAPAPPADATVPSSGSPDDETSSESEG